MDVANIRESRGRSRQQCCRVEDSRIKPIKNDSGEGSHEGITTSSTARS
jgi:hypothetical protein